MQQQLRLSPAVHDGSVGALLREWRAARRFSQLDLALEAGISTRHLSYVETGKTRPSPQVLAQIAEVLELPLRERNALLLAAGHAPAYRESALGDPELAVIGRAVDLILAQQEPFPAFVTNRHWDVLLANRGMERMIQAVRGEAPLHGNILLQVFDPADMRPHIANWEEVAGDLIRHLHHEIAATPADTRMRALLDTILSYPDIPEDWRRRDLHRTPLPTITTHFRGPAGELGFFSTLTTFATPQDVTLEEIRIESLFPLDSGTEQFCRALANA